MDSITLALINDIFTGVYVLLTLIIVVATIWSVRANNQLSKDALKESQRQSKAAIDAVNKQIEAGEQQAREALYNQHKPVIVP